MNELSKKQLNFLTALLVSPNIIEATKKANVSNTSAHKWLKDPDFLSEYNRLKSELMTHTTAQLQAITSKAVKTLAEIVEDTDAPSNARVQSARTILEYAYKGHEIAEVIERLERLENIANRQQIN